MSFLLLNQFQEGYFYHYLFIFLRIFPFYILPSCISTLLIALLSNELFINTQPSLSHKMLFALNSTFEMLPIADFFLFAFYAWQTFAQLSFFLVFVLLVLAVYG